MNSRLAAAEFVRRLPRVSLAVLSAAAVVAIHASLSLRGLHADGAYFLLQMMSSGKMTYPESSRIAIHSLQQLPAFLLLHSGVRSLHLLTVAYGLGLYLPALLLTGVCFWVLPPRRRGWFLFPLLNYVFGESVAGFPGILEGPVAAAYFWLLLYAMVFLPATPLLRVVVLAMALPAVHAHEVFGFLAPLLAFAALRRSRREEDLGNVTMFRGLALWFGFVAVIQISYVLYPIYEESRDSFFEDFFKLRWLIRDDGGVNIPAVLGFAALAAIGVNGFSAGRWPAVSRVHCLSHGCEGIIAVLAVVTVAAPFFLVGSLAPGIQFAARNHPAFIAIPLAILALVSVDRPRYRKYWMHKASLTILVLLALGTFGWQAGTTMRWNEYLEDFRNVQRQYRGLIPWSTAQQMLSGSHQRLFAVMSWPWTNPSMSILLSPHGRVSSMIANPADASWQPFDPARPETLPRSLLFDTGSYLSALSGGGP